MRVQDVPQRGKRGNVVASRNRFGQYVKQRAHPEQPGTPAQHQVWGSMTELSRIWNEISDEQRAAWHRRAQEVKTRGAFGEIGRLDGVLLFKKINSVLRTCGRELLLDPPPFPVFGSNPVMGFVIGERRGRIAMILKLSAKVRWEDRPPQEDLMVFAWAPCNAGASKNDLYAFLGLLSEPVRGEVDIARMYLKKLKEWRKLPHKRYRVPLEGSRIFVRVLQQVNGWEYKVGMFQSDRLVPGPRWMTFRAKKAEK